MKKTVVFFLVIFAIFYVYAYENDAAYWEYQKSGPIIDTSYYRLELPENFGVMSKAYYENNTEALRYMREEHKNSFSALLFAFSDSENDLYPPLSLVIDIFPTGEIAFEETMIEKSKSVSYSDKQKLRDYFNALGASYKYATYNNQFYFVAYQTSGDWRRYSYSTLVGRDYGIIITADIMASRIKELELQIELFLSSLTFKNKIPKGFVFE